MLAGLPDLLASLPTWFLGLLLLPLPLADAGGRDVVVLLREDVPVYARFAERFAAACDCNARRVRLGDDAVEVAGRVRALRPGAVVAVGRSGLRAASGHLADLPLLHALVVNPSSILPPGAKPLPGAPLDVDPGEALAALTRVAPEVRRVAIVHDPSLTAAAAADAVRAAKKLGLTLDVREVADAGRAAAALDDVTRRADAVLLLPDRTVLRPELLDHLLLLALERRVPVVGIAEKHVRRGALLALSVRPEDVAVEVAGLVEQVLSGERSPTLPRRRLRLHLNLRTAARLGLTVPDEVRKQAVDLIR